MPWKSPPVQVATVIVVFFLWQKVEEPKMNQISNIIGIKLMKVMFTVSLVLAIRYK
jgi:hypothetical protein